MFPLSFHDAVVEPSGIVCHSYSKYWWWLVKLESWCQHFVTVIRVEQVMLYLSLAMDHIIVLFSNSLPGAEEPPCSVTLIRWSKSSPISFSPDLYREEHKLWGEKEEENWQADVVDKSWRGLTFYNVSRQKLLETKELWIASAHISNYIFCLCWFDVLPNWTCLFVLVPELKVYFLCVHLLLSQLMETIFYLIVKLSK